MSPKIVVVTGASRGIGAAIARKFVSNSCSVVVNYNKSESDAYKLCEALNMNSSNGALAIPYQCDCSDQNQVQAMFKNVVQKFGKVDILVNNAAIVDDAISIKMSSEKFNKVIQTNINSAFYCSQSAISLGKMLRNKHGRIVNISSIVGITGNRGQANYAASKAGLLGLTKSMAIEYAAKGININAVSPGYIATDMMNNVNADSIQNLDIPVGRLGSPDEVANLVAFLSLDSAGNYITGQNFVIDGGVTLGKA